MARTTIRTEDVTDSEVTTAKMATDPTNADNLASGSVPLARLGNVDTSGITANQDDIALLGFKVAANGSLAKYNLVDQTVDAFEDASGVDASASTDEVRDAAKYYSGNNVGSYSITAFTSTGADTHTFPTDTTEAEILIVGGGGGGGGKYYGGGGGAGGIVYDADYAVTAGIAYDITVGNKGDGGGGGSAGNQGSDTVWNVNAEGSGLALTGKGGGAGGASLDGWQEKASTTGGSGGGGAGNFSAAASTQASFSGAVDYGNAGGNGESGSNDAGGGGGGASAVGGPGGVSNRGGVGGAGQLFSTFVAYGTTSGNAASSGSDGGYFGGGGGGSAQVTEVWGDGGVGGGGRGGRYDPGTAPVAGLTNTGGGGGGSSHNTGPTGGNGGTGIVLIRSRPYGFNDMTLVSNATTAQSAPTTGDLVITYTDGAGTATVNTDIKAYISRNGSAYTSAVTLVSKGTTGGHTILTANGVDLSGITTGTSMRWKIETLNQSAAKETRIQAVSLGWS